MEYSAVTKIERLLAIVLLLCGRKRMTAPELAKLFEVSVRTIHRDLDTLLMAGVPLRSVLGANGGIELEEKYRLERNLLSGKDLAAITVALAGTETSGVLSNIGRVTEKVKSLVGEHEREEFQRTADRIFVDLSPWNDSQSRKQRVSLLEDAISERRVLNIDYLDSSDHDTQRAIEPHTLVLKGVSWYLYAYCRLRDSFRVFRASRIRRMEPTGERFIRREVNNACLPWNDAWDTRENGIKVVLKLDRLGCARARDFFPEEMIIPDENGGFKLEAELPDHEWVADFILGFGEHAVILEPSDLRQRIRDLAKSIHDKYAEDGK
jgi:predicted DNA-binding transcriptional regulator YafY